MIGIGGRRTYLYQQNPGVPQAPEAQGMAVMNDQISAVPAHMTIPLPEQPTPEPAQEIDMSMIATMVRESLEIVKETNRDLTRQLEQFRSQENNMRQYYEELVAGMQRELIATKQALEEAKAEKNKIEDEYSLRNEYQTQVNGLQDKIRADEGSLGLRDIIGILPHVMPLITQMFNRPAQPQYIPYPTSGNGYPPMQAGAPVNMPGTPQQGQYPTMQNMGLLRRVSHASPIGVASELDRGVPLPRELPSPPSDPMEPTATAAILRPAATGAARACNIEVGPPVSMAEIALGECDPPFKPDDWPDAADADEYVTLPEELPCEDVPLSD
jgi:hypothetical protein